MPATATETATEPNGFLELVTNVRDAAIASREAGFDEGETRRNLMRLVLSAGEFPEGFDAFAKTLVSRAITTAFVAHDKAKAKKKKTRRAR